MHFIALQIVYFQYNKFVENSNVDFDVQMEVRDILVQDRIIAVDMMYRSLRMRLLSVSVYTIWDVPLRTELTIRIRTLPLNSQLAAQLAACRHFRRGLEFYSKRGLHPTDQVDYSSSLH